jgi:thioester reductase-like protein
LTAQFVTGGTGFVGAALILELLQHTTGDLVCLVRPSAEDVTVRLHRALELAADAYQAPTSIKNAIRERCYAIAGDVETEGCSVGAIPELSCSEFWHSAASLRFEDRYAEEIFRTNTQGTAHALALAERVGASYFNYMSTAYVAGSQEGTILEVSPSDAHANNNYEKSKVGAERKVIDDTHFGHRIFRPSIVIGHSRTFAATNFTGMYGFLRKLYAFHGMMERTQKGLMARKSMRLRLDVGAELNLVPIDQVVANAVTISKATSPAPGQNEYYHLTNPVAPAVDEVMEAMYRIIGLAPPTYQKDTSGFEWLDEKFNSRLDFYRSYLIGHKTFDRANVSRYVVGEAMEPYDLSPERVERYGRWYVERLAQEREDQPVTR